MQDYSILMGKTVVSVINDVEVHVNADDDLDDIFNEFNKQMHIEGRTVAKL